MPPPASLPEVVVDWCARLDAIEDHIHPDWAAHAASLLAPLRGAGPSPAAQRLRLTAFDRLCGATPSATLLQGPTGSWCLMPREALARRLVALALTRRPGVLRCCVQRKIRHTFSQVLGSAYDALRERGGCAPAAPLAAAAIPPLGWALLGYGDIAGAGAWPSRSLRRWVRLCLPRGAVRWPALPPRGDVLEAVAEVDGWMTAEGAP